MFRKAKLATYACNRFDPIAIWEPPVGTKTFEDHNKKVENTYCFILSLWSRVGWGRKCKPHSFLLGGAI